MKENKDYTKVMTSIIQKQMVILGPEIALAKARSIKGLEVSDSGEVVAIRFSSKEVLQQLVDSYISLSGQIFKSVIEPVLKKYPDIVVTTSK